MEYSNIKSQSSDDPQDEGQLIDLKSYETQPGDVSTTATTLVSPAVVSVCVRVPRPTNAFMIYANENRKCMAKQFPLDSNKEISKRLGHCWKELDADRKAVYYALAKQVDAEHKKKYPNYVYNPKEARIRKAIRDATREKIMGAGLAPTATQQARRPAQPWMLPDHDDQIMMSPSEPGGVGGGGALRAGMASPMCGTGFPMGSYPTGAPMHHPHAAYMNNPLAQLQHQTDLWNPYHHKSQTKPQQEAAYVMTPQHEHHMQHPMSPYTPSHVTQLHPPPMLSYMPSDKVTNDLMTATKSQNGIQQLKAAKMEQPDSPSPQELFNNDEERLRNGCSGSLNEIESTEERSNGKVAVDGYDMMTTDAENLGAGGMMKMMSTSITREGFQQQEKIVLQNPFDLPSSTVNLMMTPYYQQHQRKKSSGGGNQQQQRYQQMMHHHQRNSYYQQHNNNNQPVVKEVVKPLPDFNEAFGSTERGRYQSPPNNPRMLPIVVSQSKPDCVDFLGFFGNDNLKLEDYHI